MCDFKITWIRNKAQLISFFVKWGYFLYDFWICHTYLWMQGNFNKSTTSVFCLFHNSCSIIIVLSNYNIIWSTQIVRFISQKWRVWRSFYRMVFIVSKNNMIPKVLSIVFCAISILPVQVRIIVYLCCFIIKRRL